jgi:hypothetical protein
MNSQIERIYAPFSQDQVTALNAFQSNPRNHPFTCDNPVCIIEDGTSAPLIVRERGWICPSCSYTQNWAHKFMAESSAAS